MRFVIALLALAALLIAATHDNPVRAEGTEDSKPACLRVKSINGWNGGDAKTVRLDTAGRRYRVSFKEPCLGKEKSLGMRFGFRAGTFCLEPGDELVFVTIGGHEQFCIVEKIELMAFGEKTVIAPPAPPPPQ